MTERNAELLQIADLKERVPSAVNEIIMRAGFRAVLVTPLLRGGDIVGLRRRPGAFPQNTINLIKTFGAQSAVAIENARLFKNVEASLADHAGPSSPDTKAGFTRAIDRPHGK